MTEIERLLDVALNMHKSSRVFLENTTYPINKRILKTICLVLRDLGADENVITLVTLNRDNIKYLELKYIHDFLNNSLSIPTDDLYYDDTYTDVSVIKEYLRESFKEMLKQESVLRDRRIIVEFLESQQCFCGSQH